jgi:hypothetical protein
MGYGGGLGIGGVLLIVLISYHLFVDRTRKILIPLPGYEAVRAG